MVIGLSADIDVSRLKDKDETYRCKTLETQYFQPDEAYIAASLQHARVTDYVQKGWPLKKAVYMVTGLKIAKGVSAETGSRKEHSIEGQLGVDATAITGGVPVSAGPKGKWSSETSEGVEFGAGDDFVFAFRLIKIRQKEKAEKGFVEGDYVKGALFSAEEPIEEQVVDNAESFHDTWEVEPSEQMMQDLPDMIVKNTVDEEGDSCNVVFIMGGH